MRRILAAAILILVWVRPAAAPMGDRTVYFMDLRTSLACSWETRGNKRPDWAVDWRFGTAWGRCQVKYWSAVAYGGFDEQKRLTGVPSRSPGDLFYPSTNRKVAGRIFNACERRLGNKARDVTVFHCYGTGRLDSKPPTTREIWAYDPQKKKRRWVTVASYSKRLASDAATLRLKIINAQ